MQAADNPTTTVRAIHRRKSEHGKKSSCMMTNANEWGGDIARRAKKAPDTKCGRFHFRSGHCTTGLQKQLLQSLAHFDDGD